MKLNYEHAKQSINASTDKRWLGDFRERMAPIGETEIVSAIDRRLAELAKQEFRRKVGPPMRGSASLIERVQEALRVYEEGLADKHAKRQSAGRLRPMITRWGEKEAIRRTVMKLDMSTGL
jgi:histone H3/H4